MPDAAELAPSHPTRCSVCGEPLAAGPWWVLEIGRAAHERCAPWDRRPFPLRDVLKRLRSLRTRLTHGITAIDATIAWLERAERRWPVDALVILERARAWQLRLEQRLRELGIAQRS